MGSLSGVRVGLGVDRLSPLALPTSNSQHSYFTVSATTHDKVSMFCVPKASFLLVGLALSPGSCLTTEEADAERLSGAVDQLEVAIERQCGDLDLAACQDSARAEFESQHAQDSTDD